jgi:hypothetical protein
MASARGYHGDSKNVIGKEYFVREAAILFGMANTTTDPKISAALWDKAADLKLQVDEPGARLTRSPSHWTLSRPRRDGRSPQMAAFPWRYANDRANPPACSRRSKGASDGLIYLR